MASTWKQEGEVLVKVMKAADFTGALAYVNKVGAVAEAANHHPDIDIRWNEVTLRLTTHSEGKLTDKDREVAALIEKLEG